MLPLPLHHPSSRLRALRARYFLGTARAERSRTLLKAIVAVAMRGVRQPALDVPGES
jgi:hypothetical protein